MNVKKVKSEQEGEWFEDRLEREPYFRTLKASEERWNASQQRVIICPPDPSLGDLVARPLLREVREAKALDVPNYILGVTNSESPSWQGEVVKVLEVRFSRTPKLVLAAGAKSHISLGYYQNQITKQAGTDKSCHYTKEIKRKEYQGYCSAQMLGRIITHGRCGLKPTCNPGIECKEYRDANEDSIH
ncbi:E3 Ubiquitin-Protein Ligase Trim69 [Manis pentadactyla]|nr:E3 Ubiquitin-Protein Ligase Trim69 [Manis pentadactyla]